MGARAVPYSLFRRPFHKNKAEVSVFRERKYNLLMLCFG